MKEKRYWLRGGISLMLISIPFAFMLYWMLASSAKNIEIKSSVPAFFLESINKRISETPCSVSSNFEFFIKCINYRDAWPQIFSSLGLGMHFLVFFFMMGNAMQGEEYYLPEVELFHGIKIAIVISVILYFFIGSFLGLLYGKIKENKKSSV